MVHLLLRNSYSGFCGGLCNPFQSWYPWFGFAREAQPNYTTRGSAWEYKLSCSSIKRTTKQKDRNDRKKPSFLDLQLSTAYPFSHCYKALNSLLSPVPLPLRKPRRWKKTLIKKIKVEKLENWESWVCWC